MAHNWFRMYSEFATDPKVQMLSEADQRRFIMVLCLRCSNDDVTLHDEEVAFQLRISNEEWLRSKALFVSKELIGEDNKPLAWDRRQYISDSSATRVAKHREKRKGMGLTATDHIHKNVRQSVFEKCGNACVYCGSGEDLTIDHMVPTRRGGSNDESNLQVACRVCNADKRHMTHDEYIQWNGRVTLQKRPQNTDTDTDTEKTKTKPRAPRFDAQAHLVELGVEPSIASDWVKHRKMVKAEATATAIDGIAREADKAGISLDAALRECCVRGWRGFKAEWLAQNNSPGRVINSTVEQRNKAVAAAWVPPEMRGAA